MTYERFIQMLATRARSTPADALSIARATLATVAERLSDDKVRRLAAELPHELACFLVPTRSEEHLSFGEFCQRVALREWSNVPDAIAHARCVFDTLDEAVDTRECHAILAVIRAELAPLFFVDGSGK